MEPGKPVGIEPQADLKITNVALGHELKDASGRTTVKLTFQPPIQPESDDEDDDEKPNSEPSETILCSLTPGKVR